MSTPFGNALIHLRLTAGLVGDLSTQALTLREFIDGNCKDEGDDDFEMLAAVSALKVGEKYTHPSIYTDFVYSVERVG